MDFSYVAGYELSIAYCHIIEKGFNVSDMYDFSLTSGTSLSQAL